MFKPTKQSNNATLALYDKIVTYSDESDLDSRAGVGVQTSHVSQTNAVITASERMNTTSFKHQITKYYFKSK